MRRLIAVVAVAAGLAAPAVASAQQDTNPATLPPPTATTPTATTPTATAPGATTSPPAVATTAPPATAIAPPVATAPPATAAVPPATTAPPTTEPGNDRAAVLLLLVAGALALFLLALWALSRWQGWDPPWLARWRHATGEAGWRAGNAWAEFTDWLRIGR
jgi:hypothetical protein